MQQALRIGDVIYIYKLDRLGRSLKHLLELTSDFEKREIGLVSIHDHMDTTTAQGRLIFNIFALLAEFDRIGEPTGPDPREDSLWSGSCQGPGQKRGTDKRPFKGSRKNNHACPNVIQ
jgi:hypothetical protein